MTTLTIRYAWGDEHVTGVEVRQGVYRLTSFSEHVPLIPGDEVIASGEGVITDVERLNELFVVEAYFTMRTDEDDVALATAEWQRDAYAQQTTAKTVTVAANLSWLNDRVGNHDDVEFVQVARLPGETFSFPEAVRGA